jgi:hypothetical protein
MQFTATYDLPEQVVTTLQQHWKTLAKINLEDLAVIGYNMGILSSYQIQQMLHHASRWDTEQFLHRHQCYLHYDTEDFQNDGKAFRDEVGESTHT